MGEPFRPVGPVDPTNLRPMLFLEAARDRMLNEDWLDVPLHPQAAAVWQRHGFL